MRAPSSPLAPAALALALALLAPPGIAAEAPAGGARGPAADHPDATPLSLDDAVELVKRRYEARVLRAEQAKEGDDVVYRIRLLAADGRVFTVRVNARTGGVD